MTTQAGVNPADAPVVNDDLPCAGCGYLLRGLDPAGHCPECNHPIDDSRRAQSLLPTRRAVRALTLGAAALAGAVFALPYAERLAYWDDFPRFGSFLLNRDGVKYLLTALLLLPATFWLTRADRLQPADAAAAARCRWTRRLALALPGALAGLAALMFLLLRARFGIAGNTVLLASYALAPVVVALLVILLLGILARQANRLPHGPRAWWVRVPQVLLGGVLMLDAVAWAHVTAARILLLYDVFTPPESRYVPAWLDRILQPVWWFTQVASGPLRLMTLVALIAYTVVVARRRRPRFTAA